MIKASDIEVLKDLAEFIAPLSKEESAFLEKSLIEEGCREPLVVWARENGREVLIDGHNRLRLCEKNNIPFKVRRMSFDDINQVKLWMIDNQMGRRNLTPDQLSYYRGLRYLSLKKKKGGYQNVALKGKKDRATSEKLSEHFDVSESTVKRDAKFAEGLNIIARSNPKLKAKILAGEVSVKKSDIQILPDAKDPDKITIKNEADLYNKAKNIRSEILEALESKIGQKYKERIEKAQTILKSKEPLFQSKEERISQIKGAIISAINAAIRKKDVKAINELKGLVDKLSNIIMD